MHLWKFTLCSMFFIRQSSLDVFVFTIYSQLFVHRQLFVQYRQYQFYGNNITYYIQYIVHVYCIILFYCRPACEVLFTSSSLFGWWRSTAMTLDCSMLWVHVCIHECTSIYMYMYSDTCTCTCILIHVLIPLPIPQNRDESLMRRRREHSGKRVTRPISDVSTVSNTSADMWAHCQLHVQYMCMYMYMCTCTCTVRCVY